MSVEYNRLLEKEESKNHEIQNKYMEDKYKIFEPGVYDIDLFRSVLDRTNSNHWIIQLIHYIFEPDIPTTNKELYMKELKKGGIKIVDYDKKSLVIMYRNRKVIIQDLCLNFNQFKKRDYRTNDLYYNKEVYIPILINKIKKLNYNAKLVIGYIKEETLDSKKLLSWIEIIKNGKSYVIDFVHNIVIDKDFFNELYKPEFLNEIKKDEILNDEQLFSILVNDLSIQYDEYLIFDKEIKREIQKKKGLFLK